jgi:polysaccharide export outer membrane protein
MLRDLLRLLLILTLLFPGGLLQAEPEVTGYPPFLIGPGDILNITVYGEKDLPTMFLVDSTGAIVFPLVGELHLAGFNQAEAGQQLATKLSKYQKDPQVTVLITETAQYTISVLGNVAKPGKYRIRGLPNLLSAISEAGGPLAHSALNSTVLVRGDQRLPMSLGDYLSSSTSKLKPQPLLYPGDVLFVPQSPWPTIGEWGIIVGILTSAVVLSTAFRNR